ncbi:MAG TPA: ABC transporter substrate-binding protein [Vicinamibacteria bacterium]|nr:ABC transporter substrate-binding protein [Vicinamibacteria bacterium]
MLAGPALVLLLAGPAVSSPPAPHEPSHRAGQEPLDFRGPGRDAPEPPVSEVVLGWFGPGDPDHPEFGELWRGAALALEQENAAGGYHGKPFRLQPAWSESPWKAGVREVTRLVYETQAWAVLGGVDGNTTHLAVQIALKSYFLLLSPGSTDVTADLANVPWLFSLPPSDEALAPAIVGAIASNAGGSGFAVAAGTDHDAHAALVAVKRVLGARQLAPRVIVEMPEVDPDLPDVVRRLLVPPPSAVVVLARSALAGRLVAELRRAGYRGEVIGGATLGRAAFARAAGVAADGVVAPAWVDAARPPWRAFAEAYQRRWSSPADAAAADGYDAVRLVAAAVRATGLNRPRIRDAVRALMPWTGASGTVEWNALGRNQPLPTMRRWQGGTLLQPSRP